MNSCTHTKLTPILHLGHSHLIWNAKLIREMTTTMRLPPPEFVSTGYLGHLGVKIDVNISLVFE